MYWGIGGNLAGFAGYAGRVNALPLTLCTLQHLSPIAALAEMLALSSIPLQLLALHQVPKDISLGLRKHRGHRVPLAPSQGEGIQSQVLDRSCPRWRAETPTRRC